MAKTENLNNEQNIEGIISAPLVALSKANMMMLSGQTAFLLNNCFKLKGEGSFETKVGWGILSVSIKGSASYSSRDSSTHDTHYEKSNSAKYTVNVHAGQLPVPKGVNTIIEAFTQAIQPIETPLEEKKTE